MKLGLAFFIVLFNIVIFQNQSSAGIGGGCGTMCLSQMNNNMNYYGRPMGYATPYYAYPQLPYQSMWPQQNYYFPHTPSPYQPADCPFCNQMQNYQQQQQQPFFFPNSYQYPGGGIT